MISFQTKQTICFSLDMYPKKNKISLIYKINEFLHFYSPFYHIIWYISKLTDLNLLIYKKLFLIINAHNNALNTIIILKTLFNIPQNKVLYSLK